MRHVVICLVFVFLRSANFYEISRSKANDFLRTSLEKFETIENKRERCLDEFHQRIYARRLPISTTCRRYCRETSDCQNEKIACVDPSWSTAILKTVEKFQGVCYLRLTKVIRYHEAEQLCRQFNLQLAIFNRLDLLERLRQLNFFNVTCKGQCPRTKGYYIGLTRMINSSESNSSWRWSNNETWTENQIECDEEVQSLYPRARPLCYLSTDGEKRVTIWNSDEPNNADFNENCVEILSQTERNFHDTQAGLLNDVPCSKATLGAICQIQDKKPTNFTRLQSFATRLGFDPSEIATMNFIFDFKKADLDGIASITGALEELLKFPSFTIDQSAKIFSVVDHLIECVGEINVNETRLKPLTNRVLRFLERFPMKIENGNRHDPISFIYENVQISIFSSLFNESNGRWLKISDDGNVSVEINRNLLDDGITECIETLFTNFHLFPQLNRTHLGKPIGFQLANLTKVRFDDDFIRFRIRISSEIKRSVNVSCVYWSFDVELGSWILDDGCRFFGFNDDFLQCVCNHLTHFAFLIIAESNPLNSFQENLLTLVTYLGIGLSIFGLLLTLITYGAFRRLRTNHLHNSLMMLCLSILLVNLLYIPLSIVRSADFKLFCNILGFTFHYFILSSFMWMSLLAFVQYLHFVRIFNSHISNFFMKTSFFGWIFPLIGPVMTIVYRPSDAYLGKVHCWINDVHLLCLTFILPIVLLIIFNSTIFLLILRSVCQRRNHEHKNYSKLQLGTILCCFVTMGLTWCFAMIVLVWRDFIHQLFFCVFNASQGFFIFLFHVFLSKAKRELWQNFLHGRRFLDSGWFSSYRITSSNTNNRMDPTRKSKPQETSPSAESFPDSKRMSLNEF